MRWLLLLCVGCAWSHDARIYGLAAVDSALFACDATQTYVASHGGAWDTAVREADPIQGERPSGARMYGLMAANIGVAIAVTAVDVPDWVKAGVLGAIGANVARTVIRNTRYTTGCGL